MGSMDEHTVEAAAADAGIVPPALFRAVTGSTNTDLIGMAEGGAPEWTVVVADQQTAGRGRLGRTWVSPPGLSLHVSVLLRPRVPPERAPLLSLGTAVCMAGACRIACGVEVRVKWPNDLLAGDRKLGGILPEASVSDGRLDWVVLGTGVNVAHDPLDFPEGLRDTATSIALEGGRPDRPALLRQYLIALRRSYGPDGFGEETLAAYRATCDTIGRVVGATTTAGQEIVGTAVDIGANGELLVEAVDGMHAVAFGEVEHLR